MLREIINFTNSLSPESFTRNLEPKEGLHIQVELDENGKLVGHEKEYYRKGDELQPFLQGCLERQLHTKWVSSFKPLDPDQKIHSCSPFCVAFKRLDKRHQVDLLDNPAQFQKSLSKYFETALSYCGTDEQKRRAEILAVFCKNDLADMIKGMEDYPDLKKEDYICIYLKNAGLDDYRETHSRYLALKVFNKEEFNKIAREETYGVSDYLTSYNSKKPFLQHHTATFNINSRVHSNDAMQLFKFSELKANRQLPNPLPIFVEKEELNDTVVSIFNRDAARKVTYSEIITSVCEKERDLGNYYLLNIQGRDGVKDFDFVSSFRYKLDPEIKIKGLFTSSGDLAGQRIETIFEFERRLLQKMFDNQLVQITKNGLRMRYFDEVEYNPKYIRAAMFQLVLKYRKSFYDYIYKAKRQAVTSQMFHDIMQTGILDLLKQDEFKDRHHTKEFSIKEKLNIWFSLYEHFSHSKSEGGETLMANKVLLLQERMHEIANESPAHIENDSEFAYAAGQVIYYLLNQSEAGNKSHALLEPFLQKTDLEQFKIAISRTFAQYKHAIAFYKGRFEKLMAEVLSYEPDEPLKSLLPLILGGYFSECVIYRKSN